MGFGTVLVSIDKREDFLVDITRSQINVAKITHQNRARHVVVLMRVDIEGAPHRNPDGEVIPCPHLHIYRENFGDKWAHPLPASKFQDLGNLFQTFEDFLTECNVVEPKVKFTGLSGYDHLFDFVVPKSRRAPERILRAINRPNRAAAETFIHAGSDTREVRSPESQAYAILNDGDQAVPAEVPEALSAYNIRPVAWSHRGEVQEQLVA